MNYVHRKDLIDPERLQALAQKSDYRAWLQLISHFAAIGLSGTALYLSEGVLWAVLVGFVHGMLLNYLYAAQHELMHLTAFRSRRLNDAFSRLTGLIVLFPRDYDRIMHFTHHRYTNIPGKDPELVGYNEQAQGCSLAGFVWRLSAIPYWLRRVGRLFRVAAGHLTLESYMSSAERAAVIREARWHLLAYALVAGASLWWQTWAALSLWLLPMALTKWTHEIQNTVEHGGLPKVANVLVNTRTVRTNRFMHWLAWNMQYHCDHHLFAAVPFYNLPALHQELQGKIVNIAPSYRTALWDSWQRSRVSPAVVQGAD